MAELVVAWVLQTRHVAAALVLPDADDIDVVLIATPRARTPTLPSQRSMPASTCSAQPAAVCVHGVWIELGCSDGVGER